MDKINQETRAERSARLRAFREKKGLTQEQLAEILAVEAKTYKALERGANNYSLQMLEKLRNKCSLSSDYLLYGELKNIDDVWVEVENCHDFDKMRILVRLLNYFCRREPEAENSAVDKFLEYLKVERQTHK